MKKLMCMLPFLLFACAPTPEVVEPVEIGVGIENSSGLQERLPDTCKLSNFEGFVGQNINEVFLPPDTNTRVVQPGEILSQIYVADRVNLYVDASGAITRVICG